MRRSSRMVAQVCNEKVMEPLCAPCFAQGGAQLVPGLSNFQCKIDIRRDTRQFLNEDSSVCNLYNIYIYIRVIEPRFIIIPHFRIKF